MDINENLFYFNDETIQRKDLCELRTPFVIGNDWPDSNDIWLPIVKELVVLIPIPEGYQPIQGEQICLQTSFDQHNVKAVVMKEELPACLNFVEESGNIINMDTPANSHLIKLVGTLYYNSVASNFEPIETSLGKKNTAFNAFGKILLNDKLGYVSNLSHVPPNIKEYLSYNIISNPCCSINSNFVNLDETNQVSAMAIQDYITISMTIEIHFNQGPIS
ncbi:MAG: hypothetical protein ACERKN_07455 [Velocimicrobium sp.]